MNPQERETCIEQLGNTSAGPGQSLMRGAVMSGTVKISPRVAMQVARRLRLAASVRSRSMSAVVNDVLDEALPSLEDIRTQLAIPAPAETTADPLSATVGCGGPPGLRVSGGPGRRTGR